MKRGDRVALTKPGDQLPLDARGTILVAEIINGSHIVGFDGDSRNFRVMERSLRMLTVLEQMSEIQ